MVLKMDWRIIDVKNNHILTIFLSPIFTALSYLGYRIFIFTPYHPSTNTLKVDISVLFHISSFKRTLFGKLIISKCLFQWHTKSYF